MVQFAFDNLESMVFIGQSSTEWERFKNGWTICSSALPEFRLATRVIFARGISNEDFKSIGYSKEGLEALASVDESTACRKVISSWDYLGLANDINNM